MWGAVLYECTCRSDAGCAARPAKHAGSDSLLAHHTRASVGALLLPNASLLLCSPPYLRFHMAYTPHYRELGKSLATCKWLLNALSTCRR